MKTKITKQLPDKQTASRPIYRWKVSPPPRSQFGAVKVAAYMRYEAMIAAAKLWRTPWTPIARECVIENLGYDRYTRGADTMREFARAFYLSKKWRKAREYIFTRDGGACVCAAESSARLCITGGT